jgi:hypothetical protein
VHNPFRHCKQPIGKKDLEVWFTGTYFAIQSALQDGGEL